MGTKVLVVDDDEVVEALANADLPGGPSEIVREASPRAAPGLVTREDFDLVVCDLDRGAPHAVALCRQVAALREGTPVILTSAAASVEAAVDAFRAGAHDFVTKPCDPETLVARVQRALARRTVHEDVKRLRRIDDLPRGFDGIVGDSPAMTSMYDLVLRVADR